MVKIKPLKDASALEAVTRPPKVPSPLTVERAQQMALFSEELAKLTAETAFQVSLGDTDKPITVRGRLLRAAQDLGLEIAVRRHADGFAVGLMTPARRSRRGRPRQR